MAGVLAVALWAPLASATVIPPGGSTALFGTTSAARPELAGTVIHDQLIPFEIKDGLTLLFAGVLQNRVVRSDLDGTVDFYYRIRDTQGGLNGAVVSAATSDFTGWVTDVDYRPDGDGTKPTTRAQRSAGGDLVTLLYGESVFSGEMSLFTFIKTDAPSFTTGGATMISLGTGQSVTLDTVVPAPEPATMSLLLLGGLLALVRRRNKA